jgi:hypothetical protein
MSLKNIHMYINSTRNIEVAGYQPVRKLNISGCRRVFFKMLYVLGYPVVHGHHFNIFVIMEHVTRNREILWESRRIR